MKVSFLESGGFAPLFRSCELDVEMLPPSEAARLRQLVEDSGFWTARSRRLPNARDLPSVAITVEADGRTRTVTFDVTVVPDAFGPLVAFLSERAGHPRSSPP
jgi:hypothetical protein